MALPRYTSPDPYTLEELRREYAYGDERSRVELLKRLGSETGIPSELKTMAIKDEHVQVRQWIARLGYLDNEQKEQLRRDPDEFVRACLWENPSTNSWWISKNWQQAFESASHLGRLAIMRNPHVDSDLVEKIFDLDNQEFGLDIEVRSQLASAYLTNERALDHGQMSYSDWCRRVTSVEASGYLDLQSDYRKHFNRLWELASKWPGAYYEGGVRYWVYQYVGADDATKAATYKSCEAPELRRAILRNSRPPVDAHESATSEVTKLGLQDADLECRHLAQERPSFRPQNRLKVWWHTSEWPVRIQLLFLFLLYTAFTAGAFFGSLEVISGDALIPHIPWLYPEPKAACYLCPNTRGRYVIDAQHPFGTEKKVVKRGNVTSDGEPHFAGPDFIIQNGVVVRNPNRKADIRPPLVFHLPPSNLKAFPTLPAHTHQPDANPYAKASTRFDLATEAHDAAMLRELWLGTGVHILAAVNALVWVMFLLVTLGAIRDYFVKLFRIQSA
jgi:hypothetical protein